MSRRVAAAALAALLLPGAALAAAPWSEPDTLSAPHLFISSPGVAFTGDGTAVATWGWQDGTKIASATTGSRVAFRPAGGTWSGERVIRGNVAGPPVAYGADRWAAPTQTLTAGDVTTVGVVSGRAGRTPDRPRKLFRGHTIARVQLAGNARGRLAVAWTQRFGGRGRAWVALRSPGGRFRATRIADGRVRNVSVAVGPGGDVLVAWEDRGRVRARVRAAGARRFGRARTIASKPAYTRELRTAITEGRAYVAWVAQFGSEGGETGPIYVQAAVRPYGQSEWRRAQLLDRLGSDRGIRGLALETGPGRVATVAWVGHDGARYVVRTATAGVPGPFGPARDVPGGAGDFNVDDLAGDTLLLTRFFGSDADTGSQIVASVGGGAPEAVSAEQEATEGRVAADPSGGVTAVWVNRPEGSRHPVTDIRTVLQAASAPIR